jgi:hypothetical protein
MQESESEVICNDEDHIQDLQSINSMKPQIGQLEMKNSESEIVHDSQGKPYNNSTQPDHSRN